MAEASISVGQFRCPICLDQLLDPVTIPCGHSYCMKCITDYWNQLDHTAAYNCPLCKRTFTPRPSLYKTVMLAEMVENLKQTKIEAVHPAPSYAGAGDVECDVCAGRKYKAVKSCLICLESYCQTHFEQHEKFHSGRRHKMTDATGRLQEMICSKHDKQLEIFCRTDQQCICYLCPMDEHRNHDTVAAIVERTEKQRTLEERRREFQQSILERENTIQNLKKSVKTHRCSAQAAVENIERTFTELIRSIERSRSEVTHMIRDQENAHVRNTEEILKQLEQEIVDLRKRDAELEQLLQMDNHIQFLQEIWRNGDENIILSPLEDVAKFKFKIISPTPFPEKWKLKLQKALQSWFAKPENQGENQGENKVSVLRLELLDDGTRAEVEITPSTALETLKKHTTVSLNIRQENKEVTVRICLDEPHSMTAPHITSRTGKNRIPSSKSFQSVDSHQPPGRFFIHHNPLYFNHVEKSLSELKVHMEDLCKKEVDEILKTGILNILHTVPTCV